MVIDQIVQNVSKKNTVDEYWHYAPNTKVESINESLQRLTLENGKIFHHYHSSTNTSDCKDVEGVYDENDIAFLGWVTSEYNVVSPAPVRECTAVTDNYVKINVFFSELSIVPEFTSEGDFLEITVGDQSYFYDKTLNKLTE